MKTLDTLAKQTLSEGKSGTTGKDRYLSKTLGIRSTLLHDELDRRQFSQSQLLLDRLVQAGKGRGELHFFQGELYRLRGEDDDIKKAIDSYQLALEFDDTPPETQRALGLLFYKTGEKERARMAYKQYLERKPNAEDREMIQMYLEELE